MMAVLHCGQQGDIDHLLMNLRLDATLVKEQMHVRWAAETGIVDAIEPTVASYKEIRGLQVGILSLHIGWHGHHVVWTLKVCFW